MVRLGTVLPDRKQAPGGREFPGEAVDSRARFPAITDCTVTREASCPGTLCLLTSCLALPNAMLDEYCRPGSIETEFRYALAEDDIDRNAGIGQPVQVSLQLRANDTLLLGQS